MSREEQGENPLTGAGYEKERSFADISAFDADNEQIVYTSANEIVSVGVADGEVVTNRLSVSIDGPIDDIATGQSSSIYLLVDGDLRALSTRGEVSDPWAEGATQVAAPTDTKIVVFVDDGGDIHGLEAQNRLPKFQKVSFEDETGSTIEPDLIAGRSGFLAFGGSILRSYDQRGTVRWQTEFNADIVGVAQLQADCIVGLSNDSIYWVGSNGERTMDIGGSLDCIGAVGHRMVIGSADGSLTAFGDNGVAPTISEHTASDVVQTSDDSLVGLVNDSTLDLFRQNSPSVELRVIADGNEGGGELRGQFENPYPIGLQLEIDVSTGATDETVTNGVFLPPNRGRSEDISLSNVEPGDEIDVVVDSRDGRIVAYDDVVTVKPPESTDESEGEEAEPERDSTQDVTDTRTQSTDPVFEGKLKGAKPSEQSESTENSTDDETAPRTDKGVNSTGDEIAERTEEREDSTDDEAAGRAEKGGDSTGVSLSLDLVNISNHLLKWNIRVQNDTGENISDVTIEKTYPVKFSIDGATSTDIVTSGSSFETSGSMSYRPGTAKVVVGWKDSDGEPQRGTVEAETPAEFLEVSAKQFATDDLDRVEFTLRNHLHIEIRDTVEITSVGRSRNNFLGQHHITLQPGVNTISKYLSSERSPDDVQSYQVKLQFLGVSDVCDVTPASEDRPADPDQVFDRETRIWVTDDGTPELQNINDIPPSRRRSDVIQERIIRKNNSEAWVSAEPLWAETQDGWRGTDEILPSVKRGDTFEIHRYWQTVPDERSVTLHLPGYRLGRDGPAISRQQCELVRPRVGMLCAFVPTGPNREWVLLTYLWNHTFFPLQLEEFHVENVSLNNYPTEYIIGKQTRRAFYADIPDSVDPKSYTGLAQATLSSRSGRTACQAIVIARDDPVLDESKIWFDVETQRVEDDATESLVLTLENTSSERIESVSIQEHDRSGTGVEVSVCSPGESVSLRKQVPITPPERQALEDGTVYEITAEKDGEQTEYYVRIASSDGTEQGLEATIMPSEEIIDIQGMIDTWPEQFATGWRYEPSVMSSRSQAEAISENKASPQNVTEESETPDSN